MISTILGNPNPILSRTQLKTLQKKCILEAKMAHCLLT